MINNKHSYYLLYYYTLLVNIGQGIRPLIVGVIIDERLIFE